MTNYMILRSGESDRQWWRQCQTENRVYVTVNQYRNRADVTYDTYTKRLGAKYRLSEIGIERVFNAFDGHGSSNHYCGENSGFTKKSIPLEKAKALAISLCALFSKDDIFTDA